MKSMKCRNLGGACEKDFHGDTFDEIARQSQLHGKAMWEALDEPHLLAMESMKELMQNGGMGDWLSARKAEFDAL